ncbi:hypothetical protein Tco_0857661 [Tanacetum coccineum]|uniref:Uncharacterized protein n=1 Tax=Tanacetum coccineum TaxID=301880 RepID=A0ABQ5BB36_9ASTR
MKDQLLPVDASPIDLSSGYISDSDPEEDDEEGTRREASYGRASKDLNWLIFDKPELLISSLSTLAFVLLRPLYSLNSKAFRVFNSRTRIVEENLHIRFSGELPPNAVGRGTRLAFDIDALTRSTNYEPIVAGTHSHDDGSKPSSDGGKKVDEDPRKDSKCNDQEKKGNVNSTNNVNAASTNEVNAIGGKTSIELPFDPNMPALEDYSIFDS